MWWVRGAIWELSRRNETRKKCPKKYGGYVELSANAGPRVRELRPNPTCDLGTQFFKADLGTFFIVLPLLYRDLLIPIEEGENDSTFQTETTELRRRNEKSPSRKIWRLSTNSLPNPDHEPYWGPTSA